jgi:toxin secretion/phage lysis holin
MTIIIKTILGALAAAAAYMFGGIDLAFQTLLIFMLSDVALGFYSAAVNKVIESRKAWAGFGKKVLTLLVVALAWRIDCMMNLNGYVRLIAIYGYIGSELFSIIENLGKAGVPIPKKLAALFKDFTTKMDDGPDDPNPPSDSNNMTPGG